MSDWTQPTDEQLERFVEVIVAGEARRRGIDVNAPFAARLVMGNPTLTAAWLERHRVVSSACCGVEEAKEKP